MCVCVCLYVCKRDGKRGAYIGFIQYIAYIAYEMQDAYYIIEDR